MFDFRFWVDVVLVLGAFGFGWYAKGKWGSVADKVASDVGVKP